MKVIFDNFGPPFCLAHGGAQTQIDETILGLRRIGVDADYARWWDNKQTADIIHCFGVPNSSYLRFAKEKGIRIVNTTLFTSICNRSSLHLALQGITISIFNMLPRIPPWSSVRSQLNWECYSACDMNVVGLRAEANVLKTVYKVPDHKIRIVPLGTSAKFIEAAKVTGNHKHLITTGTITERKRSVELASMAKDAEIPICFVGKPYSYADPYWKKFESLIDDHFVKHIPHTDSVDEMIHLLHQSRGYVLYSDYENWCLSAHEAIACGLPILVPSQPWSKELFGSKARYFSKRGNPEDREILREFYDKCPSIAAPDIKLSSWDEVATNLAECYAMLLQEKPHTGID